MLTTSRSRWFVLALLATVLFVGALRLAVPEPQQGEPAPPGEVATAQDAARGSAAEPTPTVRAAREARVDERGKTDAATRRDRQRRDALRERLQERRERGELGHDAAKRDTRPNSPPAAARLPLPEEPQPEGGLVNRMGQEHDDLVRAVNRELVGLAQECIDAAVERGAATEGTLVLGVSALADAELGAVIDAVELPPHNTARDPDLLECVRETALSMVLPAPESGAIAFEVSLRVP